MLPSTLLRKAADQGTETHEMIEDYLNGKELNFLSKSGHPQYDTLSLANVLKIC